MIIYNAGHFLTKAPDSQTPYRTLLAIESVRLEKSARASFYYYSEPRNAEMLACPALAPRFPAEGSAGDTAVIASWLEPELEPAPALVLVLEPVLGLELGLEWSVEGVAVAECADAFAAAAAAADGSAPPLADDAAV